MPLQYTPRATKHPARFHNTIREYRLKAGLTQARLAASVGRARSVISAWERGQSLPNLPNVFRLAKTLGTLAEALYAGMYCTYPREESTNRKEL